MAPDPEGLASVLVMFRSARSALAARVAALEAGEGAGGTGTHALTSELRKWAMVLTEEQGKVERSIREGGGDPWEGELDLGRARDTIGRRLARLRAAAGAGGVPE